MFAAVAKRHALSCQPILLTINWMKAEPVTVAYAWYLRVALLHADNCSTSSACNCCTCTTGASKSTNMMRLPPASPTNGQVDATSISRKRMKLPTCLNKLKRLVKASSGQPTSSCAMFHCCCRCCLCCVWTLEKKLINNKRRHDDDVLFVLVVPVGIPIDSQRTCSSYPFAIPLPRAPTTAALAAASAHVPTMFQSLLIVLVISNWRRFDVTLWFVVHSNRPSKYQLNWTRKRP